MKKIFVLLMVLAGGCRPQWVSAPMPTQRISMQTAARASGVLLPQNLYFTLISQYQPDEQKARVMILAEPALKMADLTVSPDQIQVHAKASQVPARLIGAWAALVREEFLVSCPARTINRPAKTVKGTFELEVTGGICP